MTTTTHFFFLLFSIHLLLLYVDPAHRITAEDALLHPYFCGSLDREECKRQQAVVEGIAENPMGLLYLGSSSSSSTVLPTQQHPEHDIIFYCPTCGRKFPGSWDGCVAHARGRKHGEFCVYEDSTLPRCISSHSMFPLDPLSGWCDIQGRRRLIEDYHSIDINEQYRFYGKKLCHGCYFRMFCCSFIVCCCCCCLSLSC